MEGLAQRTAAEEARFFRAEDDLALRRRMERLVERASCSTRASPSSTRRQLNEFELEVLAARKANLSLPSSSSTVRTANPHKVSIDVAAHARRVPLHNTFVDYLKVPQVSMGRSKWEVHQDASVFSVKDGTKLATTLPEETLAEATRPLTKIEKAVLARQNVVEAHAVDTATYNGIRVYPKLNAGRAFLWGSVLAVWGTAFLVFSSRKAFGIDTVEDLDTFVSKNMEKPVERVKGTLERRFKPEDAAEYQKYQNSKFIDNLKTKFV
ncbi:hypothetical protein HOP50_08g51000 [Chloropicon primus]|uniref:Uncharacterized protein n=1 Tax=Chloropicon primus TaxID=1764295 RepID=A0A5B8MQ81_9CHLO|nr:hypothetical protein A3770_08p50750 [Chloropicon primus]UPR01778.1 hypothetical protein HOP50_08g51000 [Chloropicon primus]|eukprot:QDZ22557.1 hypothetical protein A3770_08p50750 [Chloropicon primus]